MEIKWEEPKRPSDAMNLERAKIREMLPALRANTGKAAFLGEYSYGTAASRAVKYRKEFAAQGLKFDANVGRLYVRYTGAK